MEEENLFYQLYRKLVPDFAPLTWGYRLTNIAKALRRLYFIIIIQLLGFAAFFLAPQGQDMMYVAIVNSDLLHGIFANAFIIYWSLQCYLGTRFILSFNDFTISDKQLETIAKKEIDKGRIIEQQREQWQKDFKAQYINHFIAIETQLPKYFYFIPILIIFLSFIKAYISYKAFRADENIMHWFVIGAVPFLGIAVYVLLNAISKRWVKVYNQLQDKKPKIFKTSITKEDIRIVKVHKLKDFSELKPRERRAYYISLIISIISIIVFAIIHIKFMQGLGAISLIAFGFACWIVVSYFMSYLDIKYLLPVKLSLFTLAICFSFIDNDHPINITEKNSADYNRINVAGYFDKWFESKMTASDGRNFTINNIVYSDTNKFPVVMVAAEGGASRSGYWTAKVLARIHDSLQLQHIDFNNHIFSYSSVSGGSLGVGVYYGLSQHNVKGSYEIYVDSFFKEDMLAPIAGRLMFPEIFHVFSPYIFKEFDRVTALEDTWNYVWNNIAANDNYFHNGFLSNTFNVDCKKPVWCINSTWAERGTRAIVSNIKIDTLSFIHSIDVFDSAQVDIPYATAISVSARFPFISPAGNVLRYEKSIGHLVDGGYYENKGALTTYDIVRTLNNKSKYKNCISLCIILISNDGEYSAPVPITTLNEAVEPIISLYKVRSGHTQYAEDILRSLNSTERMYHHYLFNDTLCKPIETSGFKIDLGLNGQVVPLNWNISKMAKDKMNDYLLKDSANIIQRKKLIKHLQTKIK